MPTPDRVRWVGPVHAYGHQVWMLWTSSPRTSGDKDSPPVMRGTLYRDADGLWLVREPDGTEHRWFVDPAVAVREVFGDWCEAPDNAKGLVWTPPDADGEDAGDGDAVGGGAHAAPRDPDFDDDWAGGKHRLIVDLERRGVVRADVAAALVAGEGTPFVKSARPPRIPMCRHCGEHVHPGTSSMFIDVVWDAVSGDGARFLHDWCVEARLGRKLTTADLACVPMNAGARFWAAHAPDGRDSNPNVTEE